MMGSLLYKLLNEKLPGAADLLLPEHCALCGCSLAGRRSPGAPSVPLCSRCFDAAGKALLKNCSCGFGFCGTCGYPLTSENRFCLSCREDEHLFDSAEGLFLYRGTGMKLIRAYKFNKCRELAGFFAMLAEEAYCRRYAGSVIVPVPARPSAKRRRGWDQIEEICRRLDRTIAVSRCLRRDNGAAQKSLNFAERKRNLKGSIHFKSPLEAPSSVLLLDDVITTGSTFDYCAETLKNAGAKTVRCLAIAIDL